MSTLSPPALARTEATTASTKDSFLAWLDRWMARPLFWLALVFLTLSAGVIHRIGHGHTTIFETELIFWGVLLLWPIFALDALMRLFLCRQAAAPLTHRIAYCVLLCVAPPFRLGSRSYADTQKLWLPGIGWRKADRSLEQWLDRFFSVPMIVIALMVLPLLALEYFWLDTVRSHFVLSLAFDIGSAIIWMAFTIEFVVMVSVTRHWLTYTIQHWMDFAVVVLPLVEFMPILRLLRLTRVMELQQVSRMGRLYRLRGLLFKFWRAILLVEVVQRLFGNYKAKRLSRLRELLTAREEEVAALRKEINELETELGNNHP